MKKSFLFPNQPLAFAICLIIGLASCQQDLLHEGLTKQSQAEPFAPKDKEIKDNDKYIPASENKIAGQYIVQLSSDFLLPGILSSKSLKGVPRDVAAKSAAERRTKGESKILSFLATHEISPQNVLHIYTEASVGFATLLTEQQVKRLLSDPNVLSIEEDQTMTLDDDDAEIADAMPEAQFVPCGIIRHNGPGNGANSSKWIWIVDTGIASHADLNIVTNPTYAKSFVGGTPNDCHGHGTHVAGTAAARNNSFGVVGMSAGAYVVPIKVMNGCGNTYLNSTLLAALNHIALYDEPGDVVNMSLGGFYGNGCATYSMFKTVVQNLGISGTWVVIAAGNNNAVAANYQPGCINGTRIITVANMDCNNNWNWSSNYGIPPIDWIAVGTSVYSTYLNGSYAYMTGTSMSAPHVSGIVHSRQNAPVQCGWVYRSGVAYKVACR